MNGKDNHIVPFLVTLTVSQGLTPWLMEKYKRELVCQKMVRISSWAFVMMPQTSVATSMPCVLL